MEQELLRKVQLTQLEITKEIKRVCDENEIPYFLAHGTFLGAVRHKGFIPWDDDMDVCMMRSDYERFSRIAPEKLGKDFCFQNWYTDPNYSLPFGKVMKRNTVYLESKKSRRLKENGFYVDIFPIDNLPQSEEARAVLRKKLLRIFRTKLMKSGYTPWMEEDRILWHKRVGYLYYQFRALFATQEKLAKQYDALVLSVPETGYVYEQYNGMVRAVFRKEWFSRAEEYSFEGISFKGPWAYDEYLTASYGDYMVLPPEGKRENRHQIVEVDFGDGGSL